MRKYLADFKENRDSARWWPIFAGLVLMHLIIGYLN